MGKWVRISVVLTMFIALGALALIGRQSLGDDFSVTGIQTSLAEAGYWSPALFLVVHALRPLVLLPVSFLSIAAGLLWGPLLGTIYTVIGASASAILPFLLASIVRRAFVARLAQGKLGAVVERLTRDQGFTVVLSLRLIPFFHFDATSYAAGLTAVRLGPFLLATMLGTIPGSFAFAYLGSSLDGGGWLEWAVTVVMLVILAALPWAYRWLYGTKNLKATR